MKLVYRQLFRQLVRERVFLSLLGLLCALTSLSFFFVLFSVDGNMAALENQIPLSQGQQLYQNALTANTTLAYRIFPVFLGLTAFVFVLFFYRFFRTGKKQIGCLKALGYKDRWLRLFFVAFTALLSLPGVLLGLLGGYFLSDVLLYANMRTYQVSGLVKAVAPVHLLVGLFAPVAAFCFTALLCYGFVKNKEAAQLLAGEQRQSRLSVSLQIADRISKIAPASRRLSLRIALRKPLAVCLLFVAVMAFIVCMLLGRSLNQSSETVFQSQTDGHHYAYDVRYAEYQTRAVPSDAMAYLKIPATFSLDGYEMERAMIGLDRMNGQYVPKNQDGAALSLPRAETVLIGPEFSEIYGVKIGDAISVNIEGRRLSLLVTEIVRNAESNAVYMNGAELARLRNIPPGSYNGVWSGRYLAGDQVVTKSERIDTLRRNAVSNQISGVINQATGVLIGAILMFLALYLNLQDNTRDLLILQMLGHRVKEIKNLLVNVYLPVLWAAFVLTLLPAMAMASEIQRSLSISTNDYMPFGVDAAAVLFAFLLANLIYWVVQMTFHLQIKRIIERNETTDVFAGE